jgi:Ca2+/Na+ antiporter
MMHPEMKHALSAFFYVISYLVAPVAFLIGAATGGPIGLVTCVLSLLSLSAGYVMTSLPKAPVTNREALIEILFWFLTSASLALTILSILNKSWITLSALLVSSGLLILIWQKTSEKTKNRIRRAPLI